VIVGDDERAAGTVTIRDLDASEQELVPVGDLVPAILAKLGR